MTKTDDPLVDEVREIRDALAREFDYDIERLAREMQSRESKSTRPTVRLPPRRIATTDSSPDQGPGKAKSA